MFVSSYTYEALPGTVFQGGSDYPIWMIGEDSDLWIGKDVNGDGQGDVYDVMTMMKVLSGLHPELHPDGDLLRTKKIDAERALYLLKLLNEDGAP
ncbi:hypothetical protein Dalk_4034 [Desulfatibacillum aliphaticivorans]|uniref:Dockerin domain-containing protein n=1 Tax=Desulfatibacillum aliphaticivorans TaxID=218208 RepID=B8FLY6_DESAL|nr:hypothetical protein Dalk_4034 [Desulfatibacillum aliphaticivorans]